MSKPTPFTSHVEKLMHGFRVAMPQVAAVLQFMPDELLGRVERELWLLHSRAEVELQKRKAEPKSDGGEVAGS